jgi:hypothetical protein
LRVGGRPLPRCAGTPTLNADVDLNPDLRAHLMDLYLTLDAFPEVPGTLKIG